MKRPQKNWLEWSVFAASVCIIGAVLGYLGAVAFTVESEHAELRVLTGTAAAAGGFYRVPVVVRNDGGGTAADVKIEVVLQEDGRDVERAELTISHVPRHSQREGWVTFARDPRCCAMKARPVGYEQP